MDVSGLHVHRYSVAEAGMWHHGWQAVTSTDGIGFFIPPVEYAVQAGDTIEVWNDSAGRYTAGCARAMRINGKGQPIPYDRRRAVGNGR